MNLVNMIVFESPRHWLKERSQKIISNGGGGGGGGRIAEVGWWVTVDLRVNIRSHLNQLAGKASRPAGGDGLYIPYTRRGRVGLSSRRRTLNVYEKNANPLFSQLTTASHHCKTSFDVTIVEILVALT